MPWALLVRAFGANRIGRKISPLVAFGVFQVHGLSFLRESTPGPKQKKAASVNAALSFII